VLNYLFFKFYFRNKLPARFDVAELPQSDSVIIDKKYFQGAVLVLITVTIGYFAGSFYGILPYVIALIAAAVLLCWGFVRKQVDWKIAKGISWSLFPFIIGLFIVIQGVENLGLAKFAARVLLSIQHAPLLLQMLCTVLGTAIGSNAINNIPNLTVAGSLATMLVITSARQKGEAMGALDFFKVGIWATLLLLLAAVIALYLCSIL
jgi:arsenical pump membrane protein